MKNFIKHVLILICVILLTMFFLDVVFTFVIKRETSFSKSQDSLNSKNTYDFAFFGSSRTKNHIDCKLITEITGRSCKNFGIGGASNGDMLLLMRLIKKKEITFNKVFMQIDYNYNYNEITENFKSVLIGPLLTDPIVKEQLREYGENNFYVHLPFYYYLKFDRIIGLRELFASLIKNKPFPEFNIEFGYAPLSGIGNTVAGNFPLLTKNNTELIQMKEVYKDTQTELVFFTAPYCNNVKNRSFIDKVKLKLPDLYNYIDLFDDKPQYFANCGHLNKNGAEIFTKKIIEDILLK
jgi:hypothetical protein